MAFGSVAAPRTNNAGLACSTFLITSSTLGVPGMNSRKITACLAPLIARKTSNMSPGASAGCLALGPRSVGKVDFAGFDLLFVLGEYQTVVLPDTLPWLLPLRKSAACKALGSLPAATVSAFRRFQ